MNTYWVEYDFVGEQWNKAERRWEIVTGARVVGSVALKRTLKKRLSTRFLNITG